MVHLTCKALDPTEAESFGIINKIIPHKNFHEGLNHYCQDIANRAPIALSQVKKIIHKGLDMTLEEGLLLEQKAFDITMNSEDAAQAMRASSPLRKTSKMFRSLVGRKIITRQQP